MKTAEIQKFLKEQKDLQKIDLAPANKLKISGKSSYRKRLIKGVWNNYGGLLEELSKRLKIDPATTVAVLCVESSGRGFAKSGKMIIRFENHIFWKYWGKSHPTLFGNHFRFDKHKSWRGHKFRKTKKSQWVNFHRKGQAGEWKVFEFARLKHIRFSMYSVSMGMPQIMGFHHKKIGYQSANKMFASFAENERNQIIGLFDFIRSGNPGMITALRKMKLLTFSRLYNGPAKAATYCDRLKKYHKEFRGLTEIKNLDKGMG
jgi:hypothetical protein